jgi:hypothetical protein
VLTVDERATLQTRHTAHIPGCGRVEVDRELVAELGTRLELLKDVAGRPER